MEYSEKNQHARQFHGIVLVLFGFFCASCISAFAKVLMNQIPLGMLLFLQNIVAFFLCSLFFLFSLKKDLQTKKLKWHFFRAIMGVASYCCLFGAIGYISLVNATLLANSSPLFLPFVIWIWFRQKIGRSLWISLFIGFLGVFFVVNPLKDISLLLNSWMSLLALLGSLFSAIALQTIHNLAKTEKNSTINLYYFGISSLLTLPWALLEWQPIEQANGLCILGIGFFLFLTQFFLTAAYRYGSPTLLGPFNYSIIIFTGILSWVFWGTIPGILDGIGLLLISLGGILSIKKLAKRSLWNK
jgi:drug/metabolite transporter (DMT)-like permease